MTTSGSRPMLPTWQRVKTAAVTTVKERDVWIPAASAIAVAATGTDGTISKWASSSTPIFGSIESAKNASDVMRDTSGALMYGSMLYSTTRRGLNETWGDKLYNLGVQQSSVTLVQNSTAALKGYVGRERPNQSSYRSFPSGHTVDAFSYTTVTKGNLLSLPVSQRTHSLIDASLTGMAMATAWARVEGKMHYPTDVLAGAALANFTTKFFQNLFMSDKRVPNIVVSPIPEDKGGVIGVQFPF